MTLAFIIYLIQFLFTLKICLVIIGVISLLVGLVYFMGWVDVNPHDVIYKSQKADGSGELIAYNKSSRYLGIIKRQITIGLILIGSAILIPPERTSYLMVAGYVTQTIAEKPEVAMIGDKILKLINTKLDTLIEYEVNKTKTLEKNDGGGQLMKH